MVKAGSAIGFENKRLRAAMFMTSFNMKNLRRKVQHLALAMVLLALPGKGQTIRSMVEAVSDSALFTTIAALQGFGTRSYLATNAPQVSKWVRTQFVAAGFSNVVLDPFTIGSAVQSNVVATLPGARYPDQEIIVGGHIDSRSSTNSAPGADDDASGTAAVLEIARVLASSGYHPSATIRFIGFAAEEAGLVGSSHYAKEARSDERNIVFMLNFDMIGYTSNANPERRFYIVNYPPDTETSGLVASAATQYTTLKPVVTTSYQANVDSYSFAIQEYPAVTCIEYIFNPYYHSPNDLVSALDSAYVRDITRTGLASILLFDGMVASSAPLASEVPSTAMLEQNYPNPFNPVTRIKYTVGGNRGEGLGVREISLIVYDVLGRTVATLVNEQKLPGRYEVSFDGSTLSSGTYFYRLTAGSFVEVRKMILVK
jgi:hypothetical protein